LDGLRHADSHRGYSEEWFLAGAADGFNILPPYFPGTFADFVDRVVPELQRRGRYRVPPPADRAYTLC
jgi:alkanesulfonate monooxygenase SsuD/methylene tetrahydromethanopterin reductase-like flavin-dependent oxidoreductase (luciferase family)